MRVASRANATLAYLALVLIVGGASAAGYAANLILQLLGAVLIGWSLWQTPPRATGLRWFALALGLLALVQFVPLPPALWTALPGRAGVAGGFALAGAPLPWLTVSLAPWNSLASLSWWIPALAMLVAMRAPGSPASRDAMRAVVGVAIVSVVLAGLQQTTGTGYIYRITNYGLGTGFFANSNHQGSFLLASLALLSGLVAAERSGRRRRRRTGDILAAAAAAVLVAGVLASGSVACIGLLLPTGFACALIVWPSRRRWTPLVLGGGLAITVAVLALVVFGPLTNDLTGDATLPGMGRRAYLLTGIKVVADFAPLGSGLGTFVDVYRLYENHNLIGTTYVNHAHDDLLELLIETGVLGLAAVAAFVAWYASRAWRLWSGKLAQPVAQAASVAIAIELLHSLVDYPLRTAAMSTVVALACVLLVRAPDAPKASGRRQARQGESERELVRI